MLRLRTQNTAAVATVEEVERVEVEELARLDLAVVVDEDWIDEAAHGTLLQLLMMTYVSK